MKTELLAAALLVLSVTPACVASTADDGEGVDSTEDYLTAGDPLPGYPSFTPVRIVSSSTGDCAGTGEYLQPFTHANAAKCSLDASRHYAIVSTKDGHYNLRNFSSGACLDVLRAGTADLTPVIEWTCNGGDHQKWRATELAAGRFRLQAVHSGKCLELDSRSNDLRVSACRTGDAAQSFSFQKAATTQIVVDGRATAGYAKCFDIPAASTEDGVRVQQWNCWAPAKNQQFYPLRFPAPDGGAGRYELRAAHSGKCVTALDGDDRNGTAIVQSTCVGGDHQRFSAKTNAHGIELHPLHVDKCVDRGAHDPVTAQNGALFQLWACGGNQPNQTFETTSVDLERR
jgi:hypothetical protein